MATQSKLSAARLRNALEKEKLEAELGDDVLDFLAGMCNELDEGEFFDALVVYYSDNSFTTDKSRAVLRRFRESENKPTPEIGRRSSSSSRSPCGSRGSSRERRSAPPDGFCHTTDELQVERRALGSLDSDASSRERTQFGASENSPREQEQVSGLAEWLDRLSLAHYLKEANSWCKDYGADLLIDVRENWEDFCEDMGLRYFERRRVERDCTGACEPILKDVQAAPERLARASEEELHRDGEQRHEVNSSLVAHQTDLDVESLEALDCPPLEVEPAVAEVGEKFGNSAWNRYTIGEKLGSGATATVHKCTRGNEQYAVKVIGLRRHSLLTMAVRNRVLERLHRETSILYSLRHSHIVSLYEVVETEEKLYFVMELVEGGHLNNIILETDCGGLPEHEARYIFLQIVLGLRYIHSKGVAHRDLKPENVLVARKASWPGLLEIKISDFGHSKLVQDGYTRGVTRVGTPEYWAPEVEDSRTCAEGYDESVDLWSLGVVLYALLEGRYPGRVAPGSVVQFKDDTKTSKEAKHLVRALMVQRPQDRLSLDGCLQHEWVMIVNGPLSKIVGVFEDEERGRKAECERIVPLPGNPADVNQLKRELQKLTTKHKRLLTLRQRDGSCEVAVSFSDRAGRIPRGLWETLMSIIEKQFPPRGFRRPKMSALESITLGSALAPVLEVLREGDASTRCPSSANEPGGSVASGSNCDIEELEKLTEKDSQEEVLTLEALDAQLELVKEAYPQTVDVAIGNLAPVLRSLDVKICGRDGRKLEMRIIIPEGYPRDCNAQLGALTLRFPRGQQVDDTFEAQLRTRIVSCLEDTITGGRVQGIADWLHQEIPAVLNASDLIRGARALPLSTSIDEVAMLMESGAPTASSSVARNQQSTSSSSGTVKCGRVCFKVASHDEQMDARGYPPLERRSNNTRKESFFSHIKRMCPEVSGILSFGKPAALIAEGPLHEVELLIIEVQRYPSWKGHVQRTDFAATEPLSDVQKWRAFDGFTKVKTEDLRQVLEKSGHLNFYYHIFPDSVADTRKKVSNRKLK